MILISYSNDSKKTAIKISNKLETFGHKCWIEPRDIPGNTNRRKAINEAINEAELVLMIFSSQSDKSEDIMQQYDWAFEAEVPIVPFVVSDVSLSVSMQHFLNTHDWINAYDTNFDNAVEDLLDFLEEPNKNEEKGTEENTERPKRERVVAKKTTTNNQKQKYIIIGIGAAFLIALLAIIFWPENDDSIEAKIIGSWTLINYNDNMERNAQQEKEFQQGLMQIKQNFLLVFNDDKSFERTGFAPQTEHGKWEIDKQNMVLYIKPLDNSGQDALSIQEFNDNIMVLVISYQIDSMQVITKLTLQKR